MDNLGFYNLAKKSFKSAILAGLLLGALSFLFLVVSQKSFKSEVDILIVQNQTGYTDYYSLSKSADFLSNILIESVYSEKFREEMLKSGNLPQALISDDKLERLKAWQKTVSLSKKGSLGIVNIKILADSAADTAKISEGVIGILSEKNNLFLGQGQAVEVRLLSGPIIKKNPTGPEIAAVSLAGFMVGILLMLMRTYYKYAGPSIERIDTINEETFIARDSKAQTPNGSEAEEEKLQPADFSPDSDYWKKRLEQFR